MLQNKTEMNIYWYFDQSYKYLADYWQFSDTQNSESPQHRGKKIQERFWVKRPVKLRSNLNQRIAIIAK